MKTDRDFSDKEWLKKHDSKEWRAGASMLNRRGYNLGPGGAAKTIPALERFENSIARIPFSGCWLWLGCLAGPERDYATFSISGKTVRGHRAAWELYRGAIPKGALVLHKCDVRSCVNPDHLFLGTTKDNAADCKAKGRDIRARGEAAGKAKLTEAQVLEIRRRHANGGTFKGIARALGMNPGTISAICKRRSWKHV